VCVYREREREREDIHVCVIQETHTHTHFYVIVSSALRSVFCTVALERIFFCFSCVSYVLFLVCL